MINQDKIKEKISSMVSKFTKRKERTGSENYEFNPDKEETTTAPSPDAAELRDAGVTQAQKQVWENENASMQGKSYAYDEDNTDADYEFEDDLDFQDENDTGSGQESRYS